MAGGLQSSQNLERHYLRSHCFYLVASVDVRSSQATPQYAEDTCGRMHKPEHPLLFALYSFTFEKFGPELKYLASQEIHESLSHFQSLHGLLRSIEIFFLYLAGTIYHDCWYKVSFHTRTVCLLLLQSHDLRAIWSYLSLTWGWFYTLTLSSIWCDSWGKKGLLQLGNQCAAYLRSLIYSFKLLKENQRPYFWCTHISARLCVLQR